MVTRETHAEKRYGLGKSLTPLIHELTQRGHEVAYLCQADAGKKSLRVLRLIHSVLVTLLGRFFIHTEFSSLLWGILERLNMGRLAMKVMAKEHYTHVHCHDPMIAAGYRWCARIRWLACFRRCHTARWGVTEHGFGCYVQAFHDEHVYLGTHVMRWLRRWETTILLKAHWVLIPSYQGLAQLERDLSVYPTPKTWQVVYHPRPVLKHYAKNDARQRLAWKPEKIYIIAVGRFVALKQFPALIHACTYLQHPQWHLVLIGDGEQSTLQSLASDLGIREHLEFATTDDMGLYYSAADIYVSYSLTESFGLANLEALVMGLPSICTAVGGVPEILGSGAQLVSARDSTALISALQSLLDDVEKREYWTKQARHWVQKMPDICAIADAYVTLYQGQPVPKLTQTYTPLDWHQDINHWQPCPLPKALTLPQHANILIIAPHSDDESLGCGGTLALLQQQNCHIKVVIVTDGSQGDPLNYAQGDVIKCRQSESIAALKLLGIHDIIFLGEPDGALRQTPRLTKKLNTLLDSFNADWLFIPSVLDYHRDHIATCLSMLNVWHKRGCQERIFLYEIWEPLPATWIVDISSVFALKQKAIQCYSLPLKYCDYQDAFTGLMRYRGFYPIGTSGQYAEAFIELERSSWQSVISHLFNLRAYQERFFTQ